MAGIPGTGRFDPIEALRKVRDQGMDAWAKAAIRFTTSEAYARTTSILSQPGLIATALFRKSSEKAMAQLLAQLNMPSREEVLSLSQRLTHIELVLDDLGAALDALRPAAPQAEAARPARISGARARAAGEG